MANNLDFSIAGLDDLEKDLKMLDFSDQKKVLRKAVRESMQPVLTQTKQQIASRWGDKSGALQESVKLTTSMPKNKKWADVIASVGVFRVAQWNEVANLYYQGGYVGAPTLAYWFEHGIAPHSLTKRAKRARGKNQESKIHPGIPAKPVLRPTMDANIDIITGRLSNILGREIDKRIGK